MKINKSILIGLLFTIPSLISYFVASTGLASFIAIIVGIFFFVTGLFETNNYRDTNVYSGFVTVIIAVLLILAYVQFSKAFLGNNLIFAVFLVLVSSILIWIAYDFTKEWKLFKRKVMSFNYLGILSIILLMILITVILVII